MPRRKRGWIDNACYHITHRCHNREFLFRFKKYRRFYLRHLFEMRKRYKVDVLDYIVTSNHVHLLLTAKKGESISDGLRYLHGRVAQYYNIQTGKTGAFWSDRFHSTMIQDGKHFGKCLFYIDLNMVRAGAVLHPSEWDSCGHNEFHAPKQRYGIINMNRLLRVLGMDDVESFRKWHKLTLTGLIERGGLERVDYWTKAYAVGDEEWVEEKLKSAGIKRMGVKSEDDVFYATGCIG